MAGATIVFCDIVGFSQLSNDQQRELIYSLNADVTHELYAHLVGLDPIPPVIGLPTGDGMAIALLDQDQGRPWAPVLFSLLGRLMRWAEHHRQLRVGVHSGPVSIITDINRRPNVSGATVNVCQRIMDAAHANQVLLSETAYQQYIGSGGKQYIGHPFSEDAPARFSDPIDVIVKHGANIRVHVMYKDGEGPTWVAEKPYPLGLVIGKVRRTQFIVNQLEQLLASGQHQLFIYEQSAFSTFGMIENRDLWSRDNLEYGEEYFKVALRQRQLLGQLAQNSRTTLSLVIHPVRAYDAKRVKARLDALLEWMTDSSVMLNPRINFVEASYRGPNRLIVAGRFSIEGFKLHDTAGYEISMVHKDEETIARAIADFNEVFTQARCTKESVIESLQQRRASY